MVAFRNTDASGRTSGLLLRCVLYCLLALGLIIFDKRYDHLGDIRRLLSIVAYPVQVAVASPFEGWDWFRQNVSSRETLRADNAELESQLRLANFRLQRYEALEAETQRLRGLRENTAAVANRFLIGNIMDLDIDAFRERVLVDKGARDGVFVGQAVLDAGGVFGQVARVEQLTSEVILVSDASHAIPVQINRNGLRTIAVGAGDMSRLKLPYLSTSADVVVGDLLVTSGLGGGFPAGYPVGTVAEVKRDPAQSLADVEVRPAAALDRSRELLFVWTSPATTVSPAPAAPATVPPAHAAGASQVPAVRAVAASQVPPAHAVAASQVPPAHAAAASQVPPAHAAAASQVPPAHAAAVSQVPPAHAAAVSQVPPAHAAAVSQVPPARAAATASPAPAARAANAPPSPSGAPQK